MSRIVIHRRNDAHQAPWFTHGDRTYEVIYGGPGWGWSVHDEQDRYVGDYLTLRELREKFDGPSW